MLKSTFNFCKQVLKSRFGQFLFVVHLVAVVYVFAQLTPHPEMPCYQKFVGAGWSMIAGRSFHWTDEPFLSFIFVLDLPAVFVSGIIESPFLSPDWCDYSKSWFFASLTFFFASIQWLLVGFGLENLLGNRRGLIYFYKLTQFNKKLLLSFLIPLALAIASIYLSNLMWKIGREQCKLRIDFFGDLSCANRNIIFLYDLFSYSIFIFFALSVLLPFVLEIQRRPLEQIKIFE